MAQVAVKWISGLREFVDEGFSALTTKDIDVAAKHLCSMYGVNPKDFVSEGSKKTYLDEARQSLRDHVNCEAALRFARVMSNLSKSPKKIGAVKGPIGVISVSKDVKPMVITTPVGTPKIKRKRVKKA